MVKVLDLGRTTYKEAWDLQLKLVRQRKADEIDDTLILVEHPPVITIGKNGDEKNLKVPVELLRKKGIEFFRVDRGGDITFHGPGQLVGYLIFKIRGHIGGLRKFIYFIEDSLIEVLAEYGIKASRNSHEIGVWVDNAKIAALGLALTESVTYHGFALNINTDLSYFDLIVPCGLHDRGTTSMEQILGRKLDLQEVKAKIKNRIVNNWEKHLLS